MKNLHCYAVKVIDKNGYTLSYMDITTTDIYKSGDIINHMGMMLKIDFEYIK